MAMELWVEKYRPKTMSDYVFKDEAQRRQVNAWVKDKSFGHLLFGGSAGVGKCLAGNELVSVKIDITTMSAEQISQLERFKTV